MVMSEISGENYDLLKQNVSMTEGSGAQDDATATIRRALEKERARREELTSVVASMQQQRGTRRLLCQFCVCPG
jgi:hypothetical protein